jgi:hypothetical protein
MYSTHGVWIAVSKTIHLNQSVVLEYKTKTKQSDLKFPLHNFVFGHLGHQRTLKVM